MIELSPKKTNNTSLKSWGSSVGLHFALLGLLFYWMGSPQSGLGNREGTLENFREVGIHVKSPQSDQFEESIEETVEQTEQQDQADVVKQPEELPNPFAKIPDELKIDQPEETILGVGPRVDVGMETLPGGANSTDTVSQQASSVLPPQSQAPLGIGESAFLGIRTKGTKVVFLLDRSSSMNGTFLETKVKPLAVAKAELKRSLNGLSTKHRFQVIFYNETTRALGGREGVLKGTKLLPASTSNLNKARHFVDQIRADRGTRHQPALRLALSLSPDVVYFLTDADSEMPAKEVMLIKRMSRETIINCIEFGKGPQVAGVGLQERNFLQRLAADTKGSYRYFDITKF